MKFIKQKEDGTYVFVTERNTYFVLAPHELEQAKTLFELHFPRPTFLQRLLTKLK